MDKSVKSCRSQIFRNGSISNDANIDDTPESVEHQLKSDLKSTIEVNLPDSINIKRKGIKSLRKRNRRSRGKSRSKYQAFKLTHDAADTEASKENLEKYPGQLKVLRTQLHCKEVLRLTHEKEYEEIKMKIKNISREEM